MNLKILIFIVVILLFSSVLSAQERVDLDTINERLTILEIKFEEAQKNIDQRFDAIDKRFDDVNNRIDDLHLNFNNRFDDLMTWLQIMTAVLGIGFVGIFGTLLLMWRKLITLESKVVTMESKFSGIYRFDEHEQMLAVHDERINWLEKQHKKDQK